MLERHVVLRFTHERVLVGSRDGRKEGEDRADVSQGLQRESGARLPRGARVRAQKPQLEHEDQQQVAADDDHVPRDEFRVLLRLQAEQVAERVAEFQLQAHELEGRENE